MSRYAILIAAVACIAFVLAVRAAEQPKDFEARVVGVQVAAQGYADDFRMRPFNSMGTAVAIIIETKGPKSIIKFDDKGSKIALLRDDKDTDLTKSPQGDKQKFYQPQFGFPSVSDDGKAVLFLVRGDSLPAKGSTRVRVQMTAHLLTASQKKTDRQDGVALKVDTEVKAGPAPLRIQKVEAEGAELNVTFKTNEKIDQVIAVRFFKDGKEVKSNSAGSSSWTIGNVRTVQKTYSVKEKLEKADIEVEYWADLEAVDVPVSVEAGLGL